MSDNEAVMLGYTREVVAESAAGGLALYLLVRPDADLDSAFKAWDTDEQEWIVVNGWLFHIEDAQP